MTTSTAPMLYIFPSGEKVMARTPVEFVQYMKQGSFDKPGETLEQYMFRFSERCLMSMHAVVRIDTPENFIRDLQKCGLVTHIVEVN